MLKINNHRMSLDLSVVGFIRMGKIECPACGHDHQDAILAEMKRKEADPLYPNEAVSQVCECCGAVLVELPLAV